MLQMRNKYQIRLRFITLPWLGWFHVVAHIKSNVFSIYFPAAVFERQDVDGIVSQGCVSGYSQYLTVVVVGHGPDLCSRSVDQLNAVFVHRDTLVSAEINVYERICKLKMKHNINNNLALTYNIIKS